MDEALRAEAGGTQRLYELIRLHGSAVEASLAFRGVDLRDWRLPGGGPYRLTTRRLLALLEHLGPDSPLWAARYGEGFNHSQLVAMETVPALTGGLHHRHPYSPRRQQVRQALHAASRAQHYAREKSAQEQRLQEQTDEKDQDGGEGT